MKITIKRGTKPEELKKLWAQVLQQNSPHKNGIRELVTKRKINLTMDPLDFQRSIRDEWD